MVWIKLLNLMRVYLDLLSQLSGVWVVLSGPLPFMTTALTTELVAASTAQ